MYLSLKGIEGKKEGFNDIFWKEFESQRQKKNGEVYYFKGFVFPDFISFEDIEFEKYISFSDAKFSGEANFGGAKFSGDRIDGLFEALKYRGIKRY